MYIIFGNIVALVASIVMIYCGILKDKKKMIFSQIVQNILFALSDFILHGFTGTIVNLMSIIRNVLGYYDKLNFINQSIIILVIIVFSIFFNDMGILGFLPVLSMIIITLMMKSKDAKVLKCSFVLSSILWLIYDFLIISYTSCCFDLLCIITNSMTLYKMHKNK